MKWADVFNLLTPTEQVQMGEKMTINEAKKIEIKPIGFVSRISKNENDRDRSLVVKIVINKALAPALGGIEEWSHIYVIFWLDRVNNEREQMLHHARRTGIFAARSPIHPNPIGLSLVELIKREKNVLWVCGLDAYDKTPVIDIKPYPDWGKELHVVTEFKVPNWLSDILNQAEEG